jgi:two-component system, sensor histidine kinase YesM
MHRFTSILLFLGLFLSTSGLKAQDVPPQKKQTPAQLRRAATNLEKSLIENDNAKIAHNYEVLAQEYTDKGDLDKAKEYLLKAFDIYAPAKDAAASARVLRNIARVQELQNQPGAAAQNYKKAAETAKGHALKTLNLNDYNRLKKQGNPKAGEAYLNANIALLKRSNKPGEVADTYVQLAQLLLQGNDTVMALQQYGLAVGHTGSFPVKAINIYSQMARLNVATGQYEAAVEAEKNVLAEARKIKDTDTEISHLRLLGAVYFKMENADEGIKALQQSYNTATAHGMTFEARESLVQLAEYYKSVGSEAESMALYEKFLKDLDRIILSDKSLTDAKTFRVTEERIRRLENEKGLKDELISRKNTFNYFLLGSLLLLLVFLAFIFKTLHSIKTKNKEIALQSLRREMNPHFLFNSLNSVNQFIAQNNELEANKFLTSYSHLMRNTMENSNKDFVPLGKEIENLTMYLELEHLRFKDKFTYKITVDQKLDLETIWVPNMVIQPHLENAIWHGLRYKHEQGLLKLDFSLSGKNMLVTVDDNGIGPTKSSELKTHNQKAHQSRGLTNTTERLALLNQLHRTKMAFTVTEKTGTQTGTVVTITLPLIEKP